MVVSMLTTAEQRELELENERAACKQHGIEFLNFPIKDEVPDSKDSAVKFIDVLEKASEDSSGILFHCRGGVGRSSMIIALLAARFGVETSEAFKQISIARGEKAPESDTQNRWVCSIVKDNNRVQRRIGASANSS